MKNEATRPITVHVDIPEDLYFQLERKSAQLDEAVDEIVHSALRRDLSVAFEQSGEF